MPFLLLIAVIVVGIALLSARASSSSSSPAVTRSARRQLPGRERASESLAPVSQRRRPLLLPALPSEAATQLVGSVTDVGRSYTVDLAALSCTCHDHVDRRAGFQSRDLRRACKHMRAALLTPPAVQYLDEELRIILADDGHVRFTDVMASGAPVIFRYVPAEPWINVETRKRRKGERAGQFTGEYHEFGFHLDEQRWSYGSGPPGAGEIRDMISRHFLA